MYSVRPSKSARPLAGVLLLSVALLTACQSGSGTRADKPGSVVDPADAAPARISVTPARDTADVAPDSAVKINASRGTLASVKVTPEDTAAATVTGTLSNGKHTWRSNRTMTPGARYTVQVTAANEAGEKTTHRSSFRVRAAQVFNGVTVTPTRNATVGAGQPVSVAFDHPVKDKAAVERRLSVSTTPKVEGSWGWSRDPLTGVERVDWRPKTHWTKGTKVTLHARLSGVDTGDSRYLRRDVSTTFTIGTVRVSKVDLRKHTMTVYEDGTKKRTIPVSGGQPAYPTWNGTMVVLDKSPMVNMTSESVNIEDPYDKDVPWAVRLTTSGTYAHAAPWNEGLGIFGKTNSSHGCVGMATADGKWFYDRAVRGDLVEVSGSTRATVATGNGIGDWNLSWEEWQKLSALR